MATGPATEYDETDEEGIENALDQSFEEYDAGATREGADPTAMHVTARVEWRGEDRGAPRSIWLTDLNLAPVRPALDRAREASRRADEARPATSYRAKGWEAQLRALTASKRGSSAADRADLNPTARTLRGWLSGDTTPSKANQRKIDEAYGALRTWRVDTAQSAAKAARHDLAETLSAQIDRGGNGDYEGTGIRLRDITSLELRD